MAGFDDDDFVDYEDHSDNEEFNEDDLNDDDYAKLHETLPKLKQKLASYNDTIEEIALKEALFYNYYNIEDSIEEIKSKFPKKKGMYNPYSIFLYSVPTLLTCRRLET